VMFIGMQELGLQAEEFAASWFSHLFVSHLPLMVCTRHEIAVGR